MAGWHTHSGRVNHRGWLGTLGGILALCSALSTAAPAAAEELWEYSPYHIRVWLNLEPRPELTPGLRDEIMQGLLQRAELAFGATWALKFEEPPAEFKTEATLRLDRLSVDQLVERAQLTTIKKPRKRPPPPTEGTTAAPVGEARGASGTSSGGTAADGAQGAPAAPTGSGTNAGDSSSGSESGSGSAASTGSTDSKTDPITQSLRAMFQEDKLFVLSVQHEPLGWVVRCRELDCRMRIWSTVEELHIPDLSLAPSAAWETMRAAFRAVARLDYAKDKATVYWRLRSAGLAVRDDAPLLDVAHSIWRPYIRMNDRIGEPRPGGIQPMPWSFVVAEGREGTQMKTELHTGVKNSLQGRTTTRVQRMALRIRPSGDTTTLHLRTTDKDATTMSGYDVLAKDPRSEDTELLGRTDWRGVMEIPSADYPIRVLYIRNGGALLARLPMIPGLEPEIVADLTSDDRRLQAESFITGMQGKIMDLVARRAIVSTRLKRRVSEGKQGDAEKLLEEFKALPTKDEYIRILDTNQVRLTSPEPPKRVKDKIDRQFNDTRKLLDKFVDAGLVRSLEAEVGQATAISTALGGSDSDLPEPTKPAPKPAAGDSRAAGATSDAAAPSTPPTAAPTAPPTAPPTTK